MADPKSLSISPSSVMTELWETREYADVVLQCDKAEFHVHRNTINLQSPVLAALVDKEFEKPLAELEKPKIREVHLEGDIYESLSLGLMIEYMYRGDFSLAEPEVGTLHPVISPFALFTRVYLTAKKYGVSSLKTLVMDRFKNETNELKDSDISRFMESIKSLYKNTSGSECALHELAVQIAASQADQILASKEFTLMEQQNETAAGEIKKEMGRLIKRQRDELRRRDNVLEEMDIAMERVKRSRKEDQERHDKVIAQLDAMDFFKNSTSKS